MNDEARLRKMRVLFAWNIKFSMKENDFVGQLRFNSLHTLNPKGNLWRAVPAFEGKSLTDVDQSDATNQKYLDGIVA